MYQLSPLREDPIRDMYLLLVLLICNHILAHTFEGNKFATEPRQSVSPCRHLGVRVQPATDSAFTS